MQAAQQDYSRYIIPVGVVAVGGYIAYQLFNNKEEEEAREEVENFPKPTNKDGTVMQPTLSEDQLTAIALRIHEDFWQTDLTEDEDDMMLAMVQCNNNADVAGVVRIYGVRSGPFYLSRSYNLMGVFSHALSDEEHHVLNLALAHKGITLYV